MAQNTPSLSCRRDFADISPWKWPQDVWWARAVPLVTSTELGPLSVLPWLPATPWWRSSSRVGKAQSRLRLLTLAKAICQVPYKSFLRKINAMFVGDAGPFKFVQFTVKRVRQMEKPHHPPASEPQSNSFTPSPALGTVGSKFSRTQAFDDLPPNFSKRTLCSGNPNSSAA